MYFFNSQTIYGYVSHVGQVLPPWLFVKDICQSLANLDNKTPISSPDISSIFRYYQWFGCLDQNDLRHIIIYITIIFSITFIFISIQLLISYIDITNI